MAETGSLLLASGLADTHQSRFRISNDYYLGSAEHREERPVSPEVGAKLEAIRQTLLSWVGR